MKILLFTLMCSGLIAILLGQDKGHQEAKTNPLSIPPASQFSDYWDQGLAEITTYDLQQERYGEIHPGTANTIFVTEPFSKSKQVKLDYPSQTPKDNIPVLKLNMARKFYTGVYPYSTMLSIFTPQNLEAHPYSTKAVFSAQEWCGQSYSQLNLKDKKYNLEQRSYFESHGDGTVTLDKAILEDQIWSTIRINPELLPQGSLNVIPSLSYTQLCHQSPKAVNATGTLKQNGKKSIYTLHYPDYDRTLTIHFESEFPHYIERWEEEAYSIGRESKKMKTTATAKARKMLDYWSKHDLKDAPLRKELGLD